MPAGIYPRKKTPITNCPHTDRKHHAKGMCDRCYNKNSWKEFKVNSISDNARNRKITNKHLEVIKKFAYKISDKELAKILGVTPYTVSRYKNKIYTSKWIDFKKLKSINIDDITASYIAGFVDGEGSIHILMKKIERKYLCINPALAIGNTNKEVLVWIQKALGMGNILIYRRKNQGNHKTVYCFSVNGFFVLPVLERIYPFLIVKRKQADLMIRLLKSRLQQKRGESYTQEQAEIASRIKILNKKGIV
jgi:predicted transcriptional regulator